MKKTGQLINGIALIATIVVNYLSNSGLLNGETMSSISAKYQNLFTPAGYAFSIWGLIYLALLGFVIYFGPFTKQTEEKEKVVEQIGWWFALSCIANSLWVFVWLYEYTLLTVLLMVFILFALFKIIQSCQFEIKKKDIKSTIFLRFPFYIYSGWISLALIANVAAYLKKIEWSGFGLSEITWTLVMLAIATFLNLFMIWKKKMHEYSLVAVWALVAIAVANSDNNSIIANTASMMAVFVFINIILSAMLNRKSDFQERFEG